jgi:anti-sigma factor RsiW
MKTSQNDKLSAGLKDYYQSQSLSAQSVQQLLAQAEVSKPAAWWVRRPVIGLAWAASLLVVVMAGQFFYHQHSFQGDLTTLVLEEIAMNHNKRLNAEYVETRPDVLRTAMQRLDFSLELPEDIQRDFQLIGGRYCSIQGGLAAQLKVRSNRSGEVSTLYVTALTDKLQRIKEQRVAQGDVDIHLWQQQGRFFGLATDR